LREQNWPLSEGHEPRDEAPAAEEDRRESHTSAPLTAML